jgi:hypothetical protein
MELGSFFILRKSAISSNFVVGLKHVVSWDSHIFEDTIASVIGFVSHLGTYDS